MDVLQRSEAEAFIEAQQLKKQGQQSFLTTAEGYRTLFLLLGLMYSRLEQNDADFQRLYDKIDELTAKVEDLQKPKTRKKGSTDE